MAGDLSENALGRQKEFHTGYVGTDYLVARGNAKSMAQYHYGEEQLAIQRGDEPARAHHRMEMSKNAGDSREIAKKYKSPGRSFSFHAAVSNKATLGRELGN